ncbi:MAG: hypothetical protein ABID54_04870 [Pseudomonadota bacterium]
MWPKVRIVCGTGRCGTVSFTTLLNKQEGVYATHEGLILPWEKDLVAYYQGLLRFILDPRAKDATVIANVAFYWKNYLSEVFRDIPGVKVLFLKRDREKVVASFARMYNKRNLWSDPDGQNFTGRKSGWPLGVMFPSYDLSKEEAIGRYWDEYYSDADFWLDRFPDNTMQVSTEGALGSKAVQREIFDFLEIAEPIFDTKIRANTSKDQEPIFDLDQPINIKEVQGRVRAMSLFGQAADVINLEKDFGVQLSDEEWAALMETPGIEKLLEGANGNVDNG